MTKYLLEGLLLMVPTLFILTLGLSAAVRFLLPGDVIDILIGEVGYGEDVRPRLEHELGLDRPWLQQWAEWVRGIIAHGDFGDSLKSGRSIG